MNGIPIEDLFEDGTVIMGGDPAPDISAESAIKAIEGIKTEAELADLFAMIENKAWWVEDEAYDFEVGTEEYKRARENTIFWFALAEKLRNRIFDILRAEDVEIPDKGYKVVLEPFMKRNGYRDGRGWWVRAEH